MSDDANVMLNGFGTVVNSLKMRAKPYLPQICCTIKWRLNNKSAKIRQQAADLIARIAVVMKVRAPGSPCLCRLVTGHSMCKLWVASAAAKRITVLEEWTSQCPSRKLHCSPAVLCSAHCK